MKYMTLTPAYGRDYASHKSAKADFNMDKDFIIAEFGHKYAGKPVNKSQLLEEAPITLNIRFKGLTKIAQVILRKAAVK